MSERGPSQPRREARDEFHPWVTWTVVAACGGYWLHMVTNGVSPWMLSREQLLAWGAGSGAEISGAQQGWRLASGLFVHAGLWHVALAIGGLLFAGPALERLLGVGRLSFILASAAIAGSLARLGLQPMQIIAGALPAVAGLYAAGTLLLALSPERGASWSRPLRLGLPIGLGAVAPLCLVPQLGQVALIAGAAAGALAAFICDSLERGEAGLPLVARIGALAALLLGGGLWAFDAAEHDPRVRSLQLTRQAQAALDRGDAAAALALTGQALALDDPQSATLLVRARAFSKSRRYAEEDQALTQLLAASPRDVEALGMRCAARQLEQQLDAALEDCGAAAGWATEPRTRLWLFARIGALQLARRDYAAAIHFAQLALAIDASAPFPRLVRARAHLRLKQLDQADADFSIVRQQGGANEVDALVGLCDVSLARRDLDTAAQQCDRALALQPKSLNAGLARALVFVARDELGSAIARLDEMHAAFPDDATVLNNRAWYLRAMGRPQQALPDAERSLELRPGDAAALGTRCWIEADLGRRDEALRDCAKAVQATVEPGIDAGMVLYLGGDFAGAGARWAAAMQADPSLEPQIRDYVLRAREKSGAAPASAPHPP